MNPLILVCFLCCAVHCVLGAQGSDAALSADQSGVTRGPASGDGLANSMSDDDELEMDEELSGRDNEHVHHYELHPGRNDRRRRGDKGKKRNRHRSKSTTPLNPEHSFYTNGYTSTLSATEDPCATTHLGYCIHGYCKHMEGLQEPVCICMKGYDGERCGIQTLGTGKIETVHSSNTELVQTVLVIIAVVLSVISCIAILLMTCAHYRSHKNFLASYLGTGAEQEKLQKPSGDLVV